MSIVIVGAGVAAMSAALALREFGFDGQISMFGSESVPPYERPALSKGLLVGGADSEVPLLNPGTLSQLGISLKLESEVVSVDRTERVVRSARGEEIPYDQMLIATGCEPRLLVLPGSDLDGIFYLRELTHARRLGPRLGPRRKVVVVGGGVIGLEVAASACELGCEVTVVEVAPQVMGRVVPVGLAQSIADHHRQQGVVVRTATRVVAFGGSGGAVREVVLADGQVLSADLVVVGVGAAPRTGLAEDAGIAVDDGVVVNEFLRSSDPRIFAAGDVARAFHPRAQRYLRTEQWQPSQAQGSVAASNMAGVPAPYVQIPWMWSDQYEAHIQRAGFDLQETDEVVLRGAISGREGLVFFGLRCGRLVAAGGVSIGTGVARTVRAAQKLIENEAMFQPGELDAPDMDIRRRARELMRRD